MNRLLAYLLANCYFISVQAQQTIKQPLDFYGIDHYVKLTDAAISISNNGRYLAYLIDNKPFASRTLVIQNTHLDFKIEFPNVAQAGFFSEDSRTYIFNKNDTLYFFNLSTKQSTSIGSVINFAHFDENGVQWLFYNKKNDPNTLLAQNLTSDKLYCLQGVKNYIPDLRIGQLLANIIPDPNDFQKQQLCLINISNGKRKAIWSTTDPNIAISGYNFDSTGKKVLFTVSKSTRGTTDNTIWYYTESMPEAVSKVNRTTNNMDSNLSVGTDASFSEDGNYILFPLIETQMAKPAGDSCSSVDVWNYKDTILQSEQLAARQNGTVSFFASIGVDDNKVLRIQYDYELVQYVGSHYAVITKDATGDRFWEKGHNQGLNYLVDLKDNQRTALPFRSANVEFYLSPKRNFLIYCDPNRQFNYFIFNLSSLKETIISRGIPPYLLGRADELSHSNEHPETSARNGIAGWIDTEKKVLVYDDYDIWKLDLEGNAPPQNLTNGFGRANGNCFRITGGEQAHVYSSSDTLLLTTFNVRDKFNGFYRQAIRNGKAKQTPEILTTGPYVYDLNESGLLPLNSESFDQGAGMIPLKARDSSVYVVKRMNCQEPPNYFLTGDFRHFAPLTNIRPDDNYVGLTVELIKFKQLDATISQGLLYKPGNFDPTKKYPVIINYYEHLSHRMYQYPNPNYISDAHLNIPWLVSRGYLVFTPDIYYKTHQFGESVKNTIVAAARKLSALPYVYPSKIGISGHSFGGSETNYLVTHTNIFAAALSGAAGHDGVDLISNSLSVMHSGYISETFNGLNALERYETEKLGIGSSLWRSKSKWIGHSPIFFADRVNTPLLIFYNKADFEWERAVEFFIALRRLDKKIWLLQYDNGGHSVDLLPDKKDFTIRATQFFDCYLKNCPLPIWMSLGIPAKLKSIDNGLKFDPAANK